MPRLGSVISNARQTETSQGRRLVALGVAVPTRAERKRATVIETACTRDDRGLPTASARLAPGGLPRPKRAQIRRLERLRGDSSGRKRPCVRWISPCPREDSNLRPAVEEGVAIGLGFDDPTRILPAWHGRRGLRVGWRSSTGSGVMRSPSSARTRSTCRSCALPRRGRGAARHADLRARTALAGGPRPSSSR